MSVHELVRPQYIRDQRIAALVEGAYFRATTPAPGTGIAMGIQTAFSDTANVLLLMRTANAQKLIIPHYIRLICTAAGAASTSSHLLLSLDTANRYSAGGTDLLTRAANGQTGKATASVLDVLRFGAITALAAVAARYTGRTVLKTQAAPCWAVGDEVLLNFLQPGGVQGALSGTAAQAIVKDLAPVALQGENHCLLLHMWNPANATTPPSWEAEVAWWEV